MSLFASLRKALRRAFLRQDGRKTSGRGDSLIPSSTEFFGRRAGWKPLSRKQRKQAKAKSNGGITAALVGQGYSRRDAERYAAGARGNSFDERLRDALRIAARRGA